MTQHDNILIVPIKQDSWNFQIGAYGRHNEFLNYLYDFNKGKARQKEERLPPGTWRIVGRAKGLTEEQWGKVVQSFGENRYYNYESGSQYHECLKSTATESGMSLLLSHGIDPESNPLILIK